jgi:hypothetical protein
LAAEEWNAVVYITVKGALERRPERRDSNFRSGFEQRLRREFTEIPELCVTPAQASQLFGVPQPECQRILSTMVRDRLLTLRTDGCFVQRAASI